jgi:hypothetical protein
MAFVLASVLVLCSVEYSDVSEEPTASTFKVTEVTFEVFRAAKICTVTFWAMTPNSPVMPTLKKKNNLPPNSVRTSRNGARGGAVVEAVRYKPEGRRIDSRWCHWNFSFT